MNKGRINRIVSIIIIFIIILICEWCLWVIFLKPYNAYERYFKPTKFEPLPQELLSQICPKIEDISKVDICYEKKIKTEKELYMAMITLVSNGYLQTHDEWNTNFGSFENTCYRPEFTSDGDQFYECIYDFYEKDNYYFLMIFFYMNGDIMEIRESSTGAG